MARHGAHRIVSIGDSWCERQAALLVDTPLELDGQLSNVVLPTGVQIAKVSVQIAKRSALKELGRQFETIAAHLDALLTSDECLDLKMAYDYLEKRATIASQRNPFYPTLVARLCIK